MIVSLVRPLCFLLRSRVVIYRIKVGNCKWLFLGYTNKISTNMSAYEEGLMFVLNVKLCSILVFFSWTSAEEKNL